jgi:6-phosphogluconolactonase (cycloisomerase 2 family)
MKLIQKVTGALMLSVALVACQKDKIVDDIITKSESNAEELATEHSRNNSVYGSGFVYTLSNQKMRNEVLAYRRSSDGVLKYSASYATDGKGSGGGLGNQGAIILTEDKEVLLAVNAGSNSISSFKINGNLLQLKSTVHSRGIQPVSIAQHGKLVYVLNAGGKGNIAGFWLGENDKLIPISGTVRPLSSTAAGAAQISFVRDGRVLVITEKATNKIITYTVNEWGRPDVMQSKLAASPTPFGFAVGKFGNIFVSEAVGGAANASNVSSYKIHHNGSIQLIKGPVSTTQTAACWVVVTENGRHIFTTNTASNTISSYNLSGSFGQINLLQPVAATTGTGPIDAALSDNSKFLFVLNGASQSISSFSVDNDGRLATISTLSGLPVGANGLAAN